MKVAVSVEGPDLDARAGGRFGTSAYFIIIDKQTMAFEAVRNPGVAGERTAGIQMKPFLPPIIVSCFGWVYVVLLTSFIITGSLAAEYLVDILDKDSQ